MQFKPHPYQSYCIQQVIERPKLGLFLEMGLGKTIITLTAIHQLKYDRFLVNRVLVIAPKKVAEGTWSLECVKWDHLRMMRISVVLGSEKKRIRALATDADVYVINRENVSWLCEFYKNEWPFDMVVCDEFSSFKSRKAARWKDLRRQLPRIRRLVGLTGTPAPNGLEDLWAQIFLLDGGERLGTTWQAYQERFFHYNPWRHELKEKQGAEHTVQALIGDICVSMKAEDYLTLPPQIIDDVPVLLSPQAQAAYKRMEKDYLLELAGVVIDAGSAVALTGKLLQLCSGSMYDTESGRAYPVHACKLERLSELMEQLQGQHALLFYGFRHEIPRISDAVTKAGIKSIRQLKTQADADAWNRGEVDVLLAHPASCAYGLNLQQGGHHVIWYTLPWSLELYLQANARLHRQGQQEPVIVHRLLVREGMDEDVASALEGKRSMQDALMETLKAKIAGVSGGAK